MKHIEIREKQLKLLKDLIFHSYFRQAQIDVIMAAYEYGQIIDPSNFESSYLSDNNIRVYLYTVNYKYTLSYNQVLDMDSVIIGHSDRIYAKFESIHTYLNYNIEVEHSVQSKIPQVDLNLLNELGKIEYITETKHSIICPK